MSQSMKFRYERSRVKNNLAHGILMAGMGLFLFFSDTLSVFSYVWLFFGGLQIFTAWYYKKYPYLTIEDNKITKNSILPGSVSTDEIKKVWKFVHSYKIETANKTLTIDKNVIEPECLNLLSIYLNNLELKNFEQGGRG